jgi:hypothetical protein
MAKVDYAAPEAMTETAGDSKHETPR